MRILFRSMVSILSASAALMGCTARAEVADLRPEQLQAAASHIFTGKLARVYEAVTQSGDWKTTHSVAELQVARTEKGAQLGRLVYVRFSHRRYTGKGPPPGAAYGQRRVPAIGSEVRVFATEGKDGGYDAISPNGFSLISAPAAPKQKTSESG